MMVYRLLYCSPIDNPWEIWPIKIDFGQPNDEIAKNGQLPTVISSTDAYNVYLICVVIFD